MSDSFPVRCCRLLGQYEYEPRCQIHAAPLESSLSVRAFSCQSVFLTFFRVLSHACCEITRVCRICRGLILTRCYIITAGFVITRLRSTTSAQKFPTLLFFWTKGNSPKTDCDTILLYSNDRHYRPTSGPAHYLCNSTYSDIFLPATTGLCHAVLCKINRETRSINAIRLCWNKCEVFRLQFADVRHQLYALMYDTSVHCYVDNDSLNVCRASVRLKTAGDRRRDRSRAKF